MPAKTERNNLIVKMHKMGFSFNEIRKHLLREFNEDITSQCIGAIWKRYLKKKGCGKLKK